MIEQTIMENEIMEQQAEDELDDDLLEDPFADSDDEEEAFDGVFDIDEPFGDEEEEPVAEAEEPAGEFIVPPKPKSAPVEEPVKLTVLVNNLSSREELEQQSFDESTDFFEEKPHRIVGVISSKEIEEAEEIDVLSEAEHLAEEVVQEEPPKESGLLPTVKKIGAGCKSFGVHCGYFAVNVKRSVQRRRMRKKRQKAEEERRRLQQEAAERRRQARIEAESRRGSNGLIQVRSRGNPPQNRR